MATMDEKPRFSDASLVCMQSLPSRVLTSSRSIGWTSVLVDRHWVEPSDEPFETSTTPDHTLVVVTRGEQTLEAFKGGMWRSSSYRVGTAGITWGGDRARLRRRVRQNSTPFEKVNLYIPRQLFDEAADHLRRPGQRQFAAPFTAPPFDDPTVLQTTISLLEGMNAEACEFFAQTAVYWLVTHLFSLHARWPSLEGDARRVGNISDRRLDRVVEYMRSNLEKALTLEQLAAEAGISKFHFTRLFREALGAAPHAFLVRLRMDAAKGLLHNGELPVAEIAARCGFNGASHFSAAFSRHTGMSPLKYRGQ